MNYNPRSVLYEEAVKLGLHTQKISDDGLFTIKYKGKTAYVYYTLSFLNTHLGATLAKNKYLTRTIAHENNIPNIPYYHGSNITNVLHFFNLHNPIIVKPLFGSNGIGVSLLNSSDSIEKNYADTLDKYIFEKFIVGTEYRYLTLKNKVIAVNKKIPKPTEQRPWTKEVEIIKENDWNEELVSTAEKITRVMKLGYAAVDFIVGLDNRHWLLEINSRVTLHGFYVADEEYGSNLARRVLITILQDQLGVDFAPMNNTQLS